MWSKAISWIDDCRIPITEILGREQKSTTNYALLQGGYNDGYWDNRKGLGRFPANILVSDDMLNDGLTTKGLGHKIPKRTNNSKNILDLKTYHREAAYEDKGTNSRYYDIDKWFENLIK